MYGNCENLKLVMLTRVFAFGCMPLFDMLNVTYYGGRIGSPFYLYIFYFICFVM